MKIKEVISTVYKHLSKYLKLLFYYLANGYRRLIRIYRLLLSPRYKTLSITIALLLGFLFLVAAFEFKTSRLQARYFSSKAKEMTYQLADGPSNLVRFPDEGPYDQRLGYTAIPKFSKRLQTSAYRIVRQARLSEMHAAMIDKGIFPMYRSKARAGITILEKDGKVLFENKRPSLIFDSFESVPKKIIDTLLFIENREVLDDRFPFKNPAIEWDRLFLAVGEKVVTEFTTRARSPGGSTIATQLEKYRHASEGRTHSIFDKWRQMYSASLRAYLDGPNTNEARRTTVLDYINSIPLAAYPGYGEVHGLGDGLKIWYGSDLNDVIKTLADTSPATLQLRALYYKQALSLFIAHRRPSFFLIAGRAELADLTNQYIAVLYKNGLIDSEMEEAALAIPLALRSKLYVPAKESFLDLKTANSVRNWLVNTLGIRSLYQLDQFDLKVQSTLASESSKKVTQILENLADTNYAKAHGFLVDRLLGRGDPRGVSYSVMLFERGKDANLLRIQTDNLDQPLDLNEGGRMDLGSTAKLRTLVSYLQAVELGYKEWQAGDAKTRKAFIEGRKDVLSQFIYGSLEKTPTVSLEALLEMAMQREYSANTAEGFFTGGGLHHFENFRREDNGRTVTVAIALQESINLPFVRLMRDIVKFYGSRLAAERSVVERNEARVMAIADDEQRTEYVKRFAIHEGGQFLRDFYGRYQGVDKPWEKILGRIKKTPSRLAALYLFFNRAATAEALQKFFVSENLTVGDPQVEAYVSRYGSSATFDLNDWGYILGVHPLEVWLARYLQAHPKATFGDVARDSKEACIEAYNWLMKPSKRGAQDKRIRVLQEEDAFEEIFKGWKKVGYPFANMVPSYASALGSSGDRPAALAELVGILLNDGVRQPSIRVTDIDFGKDTPFETDFAFAKQKDNPAVTRVIASPIAKRVREAMQTVVEKGTAHRIYGVFKDADGNILPMGGKTGTGDHRFKTFAKGGSMTSSKVISRTATFIFFIGDRFFGVVSANVRGQEAAKYDFTSALAAEVLKGLAPAINPLIASQSISTPLVSSLPDITVSKNSFQTAINKNCSITKKYGQRGKVMIWHFNPPRPPCPPC